MNLRRSCKAVLNPYEFESFNYPRPNTPGYIIKQSLPKSFLYKSNTHWSQTVKKINYSEHQGVVKQLEHWEAKMLPIRLRQTQKLRKTYIESLTKF